MPEKKNKLEIWSYKLTNGSRKHSTENVQWALVYENNLNENEIMQVAHIITLWDTSKCS
jgi:hypothetical protein